VLKLKASSVTALVLCLLVGVAATGQAAAKGKGHGAHASTCGAVVSFELRGAVNGVDASARTFELHVVRANKHGRALVGTDVTVQVTDKTKVRRNGPAELADAVAGDEAKVQARDCKGADLSAPVAKKVVFEPAAAPEAEGSED
jgi:hypothetical protein